MNPEFYEDEVIEGFYVPSMLKMAWGAQMDVLNETDIICRRHNIPYFADWGTLLATIRHSGYIPWDDDFDISMRRKDYERFLRYAESELPEGFKVMHFKNHPGHHFFVARIVGKPRICFEEDHLKRFHGFPYIVGVDLFVLDNVCKDRRKEHLKAVKAEYVLTVADNIAEGKTKGREAEEQLRQCEQYTSCRIDRRLSGEQLRVYMYELVERLFASVPDDESDALVQMMPFGMYNNERYIPKEYYEKTIRMPYLNTTIPVPLYYDTVMRLKFGNYMQIHKTWTGHDYPFFYGQHEQLLATLDFEYPAYKAKREDLLNPPKRSSGIKEKSQEYCRMIIDTVRSIKAGNIDESYSLHRIAVEFGTYIESVYGEGYLPVKILEEICELAYRVSQSGEVTDEIYNCSDKLETEVKKCILDRTDIVFVPFAPKHWKYMEKLYRHYKSDKRYTVSVVPIPYYYKAWDGSFADEVFNIEEYSTDLEITDYRDFNLKEMHPARLIIQNPFDEWNPVMSVPKNMYSKVIRDLTDELIYIPFFVTDDFTKEYGREYVNMDAYVCMPGVINADRIILPYEDLKTAYIDKIMEFIHSDDEEVQRTLEEKIKVIPELVYAYEDLPAGVSDSAGKKILVYYTSVSFLAENALKGTDKIRRTIELFEKRSDRLKIIWISGCCRDNLGLLDKIVAEGFSDAVEYFKKTGIGEYIEDLPASENRSFARKYDAYYGDPSSLALWFYYEHKPVMIENADI